MGLGKIHDLWILTSSGQFLVYLFVSSTKNIQLIDKSFSQSVCNNHKHEEAIPFESVNRLLQAVSNCDLLSAVDVRRHFNDLSYYSSSDDY